MMKERGLSGSWFGRWYQCGTRICSASSEVSGSFDSWWRSKRERVHHMVREGAAEREREIKPLPLALTLRGDARLL